MSSKVPDSIDFREQLVRRFLDEHGLEQDLLQPLLRIFRASSIGTPTVIREPSPSSVETLFIPDSQTLESDSAPPTLPSLFEDEQPLTIDEQPALPKVAFDSLGLLGRGGMAEVHRARDAALHRVLAMKILDARYLGDHRMRARFLAEAQITAQLAHPSIPAVHGVGEIDRGLPFFTMKEVAGETLSATIQRVYAGDADHHWTQTRLLSVFQKVCEAVAYAHARGVIHGDLKPANIMVGDFGEVLVMDWGVARLVDPASEDEGGLVPVSLGPGARTANESAVAGTPAYMPPEQALGQGDKLGPPADIYALGVVLFELLCGFRPYTGSQVQLLVQASEGKLPPMEPLTGGQVHEGLAAIVRKAMDPNPDSRYPHAGALAEEIARWLEGSIRRDRALAEVRTAQRQLADTHPIRRRAAHLRELADERLRELGPDAPAAEKAAAWNLQDEADKLERESELAVAEITQRLNAALAQAPDLREAHELLARIHLDQHQAAERRRDRREAARLEVLLRANDVGSYEAYLAGTAALTLHTHVPAEAIVHRVVERDRRLVTERFESLGTTPLTEVELPIGSYVIELRAKDRPPLFYPVSLDRMQPWLTRAPGETSPTPVYLPAEGEIGADEVYVPAGWCTIGGDPSAPGSTRRQRVWVDAFAMRLDPVTNREFFPFLGTSEPSAARARRELFRARVHLYRHDSPAVGMSWQGAQAYTAWLAKTEKRSWRLPTELEWEKAARGPDARFHPWGDRFDASFALVRAGTRLPQFPGACGEQQLDTSPYGIRGMAGNVRDWCLDGFHADAPESLGERRSIIPESDGPLRAVRGGSWRQPPDAARSAARAGLSADQGYADVGLRLVRTLEG
ncbi:MAG: protein kinase [Deltaproteobacteria bacterium]|nr:MAG: protein kinase [Deltaproteobacteria bacterium]